MKVSCKKKTWIKRKNEKKSEKNENAKNESRKKKTKNLKKNTNIFDKLKPPTPKKHKKLSKPPIKPWNKTQQKWEIKSETN